MRDMSPTQELSKLDEAHSILIAVAEHGNGSAVLSTIASVLYAMPGLDNSVNGPYFWQEVIRSLHIAADTAQQNEISNELSLANFAEGAFIEDDSEPLV